MSREILDQGVLAVIGKEAWTKTSDALKRNGAVFMAAVACAALYVNSVKKVKNVHWLDLGAEAIWELEVKNSDHSSLQWTPLAPTYMKKLGKNRS